MTIGIIGLGYVGLTFAIAAADKGITVYGVEKEQRIKLSLADGHAHFFEPGLDDKIKECMGKKFFCVQEFPRDVQFDAFMITVGTPLFEQTKEPNFDYIVSSLEAISNVYSGRELVILRSTVSVGTSRNVVLPRLKDMAGNADCTPMIAMCPERTVEGKALVELTTLPQVVSGNTLQAVSLAKQLFARITSQLVEAQSLEEAELIKLYCNIYRDMNFALGNVLNVAAQTFGLDGISVIRNANEGYARSNIASPGFVAGPCLEKDAYILMNNMQEGKSKDFIFAARHFNESLEDDVVDWAEHKIGAPAQEKELLLTGMAFKGVPETSDLRGSSSVYIARKLKEKGYKLRLHDFVARHEELQALNLGEVYEDLNKACEGIAGMLVLNNCSRYHAFHFTQAMEGVRILDVWDCCDELREREERDTIGNMLIEEKI